MEARQTTDQNDYEGLMAEARKMFESFSINMDECEAFEHTVLLLANFKEKPDECYVEPDPKNKAHCIFSLVLSEQSIPKLIKQLNKQFPSIEAKDITEEADDHQDGKSKLTSLIDGKPTRNIQMNAKILKVQVLPLVKRYFDDHDEHVHRYARRAYSYEKLLKTFDTTLLKEEGVAGSYFDEITYYLLDDNFSLSDWLPTHLLMFLPKVLTFIVLNYLNIKNTSIYDSIKEDINLTDPLILNESDYDRKTDDAVATTFSLMITPKQAAPIGDYFNRIVPGSAKAETEPTIDFILPRSITKFHVDNRTLDRLRFDIVDQLKLLPQNTIDYYRLKSKTIKWTTQDCINQLKEISEAIELRQDEYKKNLYHPFQQNLQALISHLETKGLEQKENKSTLEQILAQVKETHQKFAEPLFCLKEDLEPSSPPAKKLRTISFFREKLKNIAEIFEGIDVISNKRFTT